jgi:2-polyprenyl-3-methyl-5-hydroxy-6-metoxy-1,4-benzoquinol methylase
MEFPNPPKNCAACETEKVPCFSESYHDAIGGQDYRIKRCVSCDVEFSEPRTAVSGEWYAAAAPLRLETFSGVPSQDWRFKSFLSEELPAGSLLDIGCGDGGFLELVKKRGWKVAGFDYDERVAQAARDKGLSDVSAEEFLDFVRRRKEGEFDAVTLFDVLEHTPEPLRFLEEVRRILRPGGALAVTLPNALRPLPWGREEHDYPPHHFTRWTPKALREFLENNGFRVLRLEATRLPVYFLAEHFFYYGIMRRILPIVKKSLFGSAKGKDATVSDLYARESEGGRGLRTALKDPRARHKAVVLFKYLCTPLSYFVASVMTLFFRATRGLCGEHLYVFAQHKNKEGD